MNYCRLCANFLKLFLALKNVVFVTSETIKLPFLSHPTIKKRHFCHLMQTDLTIFRSVSPISTFSMPSIFSVRMPLFTALENNSATRARS